MPKIVDHEDFRQNLAARAAVLFAQYGYSGLGMRKIAEQLGLSKSALYHYFPTKKALFLACTAAATAPQQTQAPVRTGTPAHQLTQLASEMRGNFSAEMALVFDYIRGMSADQIAADPAMQQAMQNYHLETAAIAGDAKADAALALMIGALMLDLFKGGHWPEDDIQHGFQRLLDS